MLLIGLIGSPKNLVPPYYNITTDVGGRATVIFFPVLLLSFNSKGT